MAAANAGTAARGELSRVPPAAVGSSGWPSAEHAEYRVAADHAAEVVQLGPGAHVDVGPEPSTPSPLTSRR